MKNQSDSLHTRARELEEESNILNIDESRLNRECVRLPNQYRQVAFQLAETDRDIAEAEAERDVRKAELALKIRNSPAEFGMEKVTEDCLKQIIVANPRIQKLEAKIRTLRHKQSMEKALVAGLEVKKRSLTNLVELHSAGYFAEVRMSGQGRESLDKISRERQARPIPRDRER